MCPKSLCLSLKETHTQEIQNGQDQTFSELLEDRWTVEHQKRWISLRYTHLHTYPFMSTKASLASGCAGAGMVLQSLVTPSTSQAAFLHKIQTPLTCEENLADMSIFFLQVTCWHDDKGIAIRSNGWHSIPVQASYSVVRNERSITSLPVWFLLPGIKLGFERPVFFERHAVGGEYGASWKAGLSLSQ